MTLSHSQTLTSSKMMYPFPMMGQQYRPAQVDFDEVVLRIKRGQRASNEWKQRWWKWCDGNGKVRDPTRYSYELLVQALATCGEPPRGPPINENKKTLTKEGVVYTRDVSCTNKPEFNQLVSIIKDGQRTDPAWRASWSKFCETSGKGTYDPSKHPLEFLEYALQKIGNPPKAPSRHYSSLDNRGPSKVESNIISIIKSLQKSSPAFKAAYMTHCDKHAAGIRDPARHSHGFLNEFMDVFRTEQSALKNNQEASSAECLIEIPVAVEEQW